MRSLKAALLSRRTTLPMAIIQAPGEEMAGEQPVQDGVIGLGRVPRKTCLTFLLLPAEGMVQSNCVCAAWIAGLKVDGASTLLAQSRVCGSGLGNALDRWCVGGVMSFVSIWTSASPWHVDHPEIFRYGTNKRPKVAPIECNDSPALGCRELINVSVAELTMLQIVSNTLDIEAFFQLLQQPTRQYILNEGILCACRRQRSIVTYRRVGGRRWRPWPRLPDPCRRRSGAFTV
jgi:hypothetical protein